MSAPDRTCHRCGCTDLDCSGCVERTGAPCDWVEADLCSACTDLALPETITPAIAEVLGLMNFRSVPLAHLFRAAGHDIPRKVEAEQAFVLWRFLALAIIHGPTWHKHSVADVEMALAQAKARRDADISKGDA